jgi:hypothetical protein
MSTARSIKVAVDSRLPVGPGAPVSVIAHPTGRPGSLDHRARAAPASGKVIHPTVALRSTGMTRQTPQAAVRWPTAAALLVASVAHIPVIPEHLHEAPYMGVLFIGFTIVSAALAVAVAVRGAAPAPFVVSGVLCAVAIATYCLTRLVAFPQLADDVGNWGESLGVVSIASEAAVVAFSLMAAAALQRPVRSARATAAA